MNLFEKIANAKPLNQYGDYIKEGQHRLILKDFQIRKTEQRGEIVAAEFVVKESTAHKPGSLVGVPFFISDSGWQGDRERSKLTAFVKELVGTDDNREAAETATELTNDTQPGRGLEVACAGVPKGKNGFVEAQFSHVADQSPEAIAANRKVAEGEATAPEPQKAPEPEPQPQQSSSLLGRLKG